MTPPDSGDLRHECRCGSRIVGRDAEGAHTWSECKPDSGEREVTVLTADELAELHALDRGGEATALEWRAAVLAAHPFLLAEVEHHRAYCPSADLAQRILAALEDYGTPRGAILARELRAAVERKP